MKKKATKKAPSNIKSGFYCGPCPVCGKKGIPRGRGASAVCICPVHGSYPATYTK